MILTKEETLKLVALSKGYIDEVDMICVNGAIDPVYEAMEDWAKSQPIEWISVKDRPLTTQTHLGWECTEDGNKEFIAAVPYTDSKQPGKELWWIKHCVIEDETGLCVVGDDENASAGWLTSDVTHYFHLPQPPKND